VVLSDREREALAEIERRLLIEDPRYSKSFVNETKLLPTGKPEFVDRAYRVLIALILMLTALFLLVGSPVSALFFSAIAALTWSVRHYGARRRTGP
jgi:hypothetical protein